MYFLDITRKSIIGDNVCTELKALLMLMFVRADDFLGVSINQYPQQFWALLHNFPFTRWSVLLSLCCSHVVHLFTVLLSEEGNISDTYYSKNRNVLILILFHYFH